MAAVGIVDYRYVRVFPHDPHAAYAWLTDYRDDDPSLTSAIVKRRDVVKREGNVVTLDADLVTVGRKTSGKAEVHLFPERLYWEARIVEGPGRGTVYTYQLTATQAGHARLEVHYKVRVRRWSRRVILHLATPFVLREVDQMWKGFARAMDKDLASMKA